MANYLISNYFKLHNANQFKESINETANSTYYVFAARHLPYPNGDDNPSAIVNSVDASLYTPYDEMLFGKRVNANDVCIMTKRINYESGTIYQPYRETTDLSNSNFYVCVSGATTFDVFKCLDNAGNSVSTATPNAQATSADDVYYQTNDGYVWKYMYSVDTSLFNKFATADYMPIIPNADVVGNATSGTIDTILVNYPGSNYNGYLSNNFISTNIRVGGDSKKYGIAENANPANNFYLNSFIKIVDGVGEGEGRKIVDYYTLGSQRIIEIESAFNATIDTSSVYEITPYVYIQGDGDGAVARAIVNSVTANTISSIEILNGGNNYTWASATVLGNTGGVSNAAVLEVVKGPKGGHGSNPEYELGGSALCISVNFSNNETGTIPTQNDYRTFGLLKDPLFANVNLTVNTASLSGSFTEGETVIQANTNAIGTIVSWDTINTLDVTNVYGTFQAGKTITGQSTGTTANLSSLMINGVSKDFTTFDQRHRFTIWEGNTINTGTFNQDEVVFQTDTQISNAVFHSNTTSNIYLTHIKGAINTGNTIIGTNSEAIVALSYHYPPDLIVGSGEVLYIENILPIERSNSQTETIKLILQF